MPRDRARESADRDLSNRAAPIERRKKKSESVKKRFVTRLTHDERFARLYAPSRVWRSDKWTRKRKGKWGKKSWTFSFTFYSPGLFFRWHSGDFLAAFYGIWLIVMDSWLGLICWERFYIVVDGFMASSFGGNWNLDCGRCYFYDVGNNVDWYWKHRVRKNYEMMCSACLSCAGFW